MQVTIPDSTQVNRVLHRLASNSPPSDLELAQVLNEPVARTGLDHWALWTLICLRRHLNRQRWVGYIVESRLKGDLRQLGCAGAFGHPEGMPQSGKVPGEPDWSYFFHGGGCCLTNDVAGDRVDVDFTRDGGSDKIDPFFYSEFLQSLSRREFPEEIIRRVEPFEHAWQAEIDRLGAANCVETEHGLRLTTHGMRAAEVLVPLSERIGQLLEEESASACRLAPYAAVAVGDVILASRIVVRTDVCEELQTRMARESEQANNSRALFLEDALREKLR